MSARRTVTVHTSDHGPVVVPEPSWCVGNHPDGDHRVDITHVGAEHALTVSTRQGPVILLTASLEARPYVADAFLRGPFVSVEVDGEAHPTGLAGLERMAAELEAHAEHLRDRARDLAVALAGGEER